MNSFLMNTRGFRPFLYTLVLIPGNAEPGALQSIRCDTLSDPIAQLTRLGAVQIVIASESDRAQIEDMVQHQNTDAMQRWLEKGLRAGTPQTDAA